jgi:hypothetical protein
MYVNNRNSLILKSLACTLAFCTLPALFVIDRRQRPASNQDATNFEFLLPFSWRRKWEYPGENHLVAAETTEKLVLHGHQKVAGSGI